MPDSSFRPTLRRSFNLFRVFRVEQTEPARFYRTLARDSVDQLATFVDLDGRWVLDVGGGPGYFADAFRAAGATYTPLDADLGELSGLGEPEPGTVLGSGMQLPFADGSFGVTYSSNVLEHVPDPWRMAEEMVRVTEPGGLVFLSYTLWWGPHGGHETAPWHFLGGHRAARRYAKKHGHPPKNLFGTSLFVVTAGAGRAWAARQQGAEIVSVFPRYLPRWAWWVLRVPGLRELVTWNLAIVLRKT
ncbi:class I SAM-dependent methyltransferase [Aeromicrobium wangtongii]|uniref:class I SAM-dependent methyltransferase n=1 Tax=Aeromicrobium wangtongii TaxID=2969247 RepID=UPI0020177E82|nr:class I SAM-dependent methyltransferase [Aeromicrobium wangtongii]MCL3818529.1 class I SAM-dependent methyltransferase [Aeromicrobium wangtongii]